MRKIFIFLLPCFFIALLLFPFSVQAVSSSSENYSATGQNNYGSGSMDSENYSINGVLTDASGYAYVSKDISPTPVPTPTIDPTSQIDKNKLFPEGFQDNVIIEKILEISNLGSLSFGEIADDLNIPFVSAVLALSLAVSLIPMLLNLPLLAPFANIWARILGFFGYYKKREEKWGIVYDAETKKPIALAVVQLFGKEYNKLLNTQITDREGRFSFLSQPGKYYLRVTKKNYIFPSKMEQTGYHATDIELNSPETINYNIPLDPQIKTLAHRINILMSVGKVFNIIRIPLLVFGTVITVYVYINFGGTLNLIFIIFYAVIWIIELYKLRKAKPIGKTFDQVSRTPLDLTILRLFNEKNKLVSTRVSDARGRFSFLVNPGDYYLTALKQEYDPYKTKSLEYSKAASIDLDIGLNKQAAPVTENLVPKPIINPAPKPALQTPKPEPILKPAPPLHPLISQIQSQPQEKKIEFPKITIRPDHTNSAPKPKTEQTIADTKPNADENNQETLLNLRTEQTSSKPFWEPRRI